MTDWIDINKQKPKDNQRVWVYIPFFPDKWSMNVPSVIKLQWDGKQFLGMSKENQPYIICWFPETDGYTNVPPAYP